MCVYIYIYIYISFSEKSVLPILKNASKKYIKFLHH
jgi:hypothetical protein